jgi:branched-chain amino acid transport system permease protein
MSHPAVDQGIRLDIRPRQCDGSDLATPHRRVSRINAWLIVVPGILLIVALASPGDFYINLASRILVYAIFALSLNLVVGYAGLLTLCHSAFFGISGYCVAWLSVEHGASAIAAIAIALLLATAVGALFGALALRAKGIGFLMITLALGQIVWGLAMRWTQVTGGENGIRGLKRPALFGLSIDTSISFYALACVIFIIVYLAMYCFTRSPFGASLQGARDQPRRVSALGFDIWQIRWITFPISSFFAAIAGVLGVYLDKFISPNVLSLMSSAEGLLMVIVGGAGVVFGPVVGAAVVLIFTHVMSASINRWTAALGGFFWPLFYLCPMGWCPAADERCNVFAPLLRA